MAVSVIRHMLWHIGTGTQGVTCCCVNRALGIWYNPLALTVHVLLMVDWMESITCLEMFTYVSIIFTLIAVTYMNMYIHH